ncbi:MAG TPA: hypothetical protein PLV19_11475 [Nitrosomonas sp.]|nr:hypothetical protein [Nitrosomonas sp.]HQX14768.1 hypothetical protein [Nitrosomonas sp.]HRB33404.1 hypothetical protein [Nitrosomonas sp.]
MDLQSLKDFIHDQKGSNHDFFISVATDRDSEIVELPDYVADYIRVLGGKICFSFTCMID